MKVLVSIGWVLLALAASSARAEEPDVALCNFVLVRTEEYIRLGDMEGARRNRESLERCRPIFQEARRNAVQDFLDRTSQPKR